MTEVVLPYDRSIVGQETGYWCGPAAAQVVLNSNGIRLAESQLAKEIGTTTRGTDYVGLIERVLDRYAADANYTSVYTERDPMTGDQKETLWRNLVQSISAGRGVVMNWVAPPSNKPRGAKGSVSPRYSGGTTFHYVSAMGYSDEGGRFIWIADSGFQPQGYWITFDQCATLIPPKGYCYANTGKMLPPTPIQTPAVALLSKALGDTLTLDQYAKLLPFVVDALDRCYCKSQKRIAMWLAQIGHESVGLKYMRELWGPTADQRNYDNMMGNGPGEGRKYLGRGPIQITGKDNYRTLSQWAFGKGYVSSPTFFVDNPVKLEEYQYAFLGAIWYWTSAQPLLNSFADQGNLEDASKAINAPAWIGRSDRRARGIEDRIARYNRCMTMDLTKLLERESEDDDVSPEIEQMIRDLHTERFGPVGSISKYKVEGEGKIWSHAKFEDNADLMLYDAQVERRAVIGHSSDIALVAREAAKGDTASIAVFKRISSVFLTAEQLSLQNQLSGIVEQGPSNLGE